ncbi:MAG: non-heme iron oxygenase ferredoxin subunit [Armatimonadetes bacterium]|nr:non-heme iron oxygenase ferredoxin subunit [Armatimonadota bacterium]
MPDFVKVAAVNEIAAGEAKRVEVGGERVALFNVAGEFYAISDVCSHAEASLSEGFVEEDVVECPLHGARFNVRTGKNLSLPALFPVARYEVRLSGEDILVAPRER